jgi:hypothetical protein
LTYDDAREADERQHEGHVGFSSSDAAARFERIYGLSTAQDPGEQQALQQKFHSVQAVRKGCWTTDIRHDPRQQHLQNQKVGQREWEWGWGGKRRTFVRTLA